MYVPGYFPSTMSSFTGLKVYRNNAYGIFIHRCHNLRVDQSLFADNNFGIDLDRAEGIEVTNTRIIGMSPSYKALMDRQYLLVQSYRILPYLASVQIQNVQNQPV